MKIVNGKAKFEANDYELAKEMLEDGVLIFIDDIGAFGGGRGKVIGFDTKDANNYFEDIEDESEDPTLADQIVCIDKMIGQSDLNWGEWYLLYEDMWTPAEEYENWVERENMKTTRENESFNKGVSKMNLNEAKRILRKNGYEVNFDDEDHGFSHLNLLCDELLDKESKLYDVEFDGRYLNIYFKNRSQTIIEIEHNKLMDVFELNVIETKKGEEETVLSKRFKTAESLDAFLTKTYKLKV